MESNTTMTYDFSIEGPSCANSCTNNNGTDACKADESCLCQSSQWSTNYACCVQQACNTTDYETSIQNWQNICSLEVVPPVTASITSCLPTATPNSNAPRPTNAQTTQAAAPVLSTTQKFEIGIGVGVGVPVIIALILMVVITVRICKRRRRLRSSRLTQYNLDRVYGTSAENLHDHMYLNEARNVPATIYANPVSPLESISRSNRSFPLSPPAVDVPMVFSRDPKKLSDQAPSPLKTPPVFEAFHPSKRIVPVTQALRADVRHSSHAFPGSSQRPSSSSSSCYSEEIEKGPYEMGL